MDKTMSQQITIGEIEEIFEGERDDSFFDLKDSNDFLGIQFIRKYIPTAGVCSAEHDIIYCVTTDDLVEAGVTKEDALQLFNLNWIIEGGYLACYV